MIATAPPAPMSPMARRKEIDLGETWRRYKRTGDREARNQLIVAYSPIVKYSAGRMVARMPPHVELADLVSYGFDGPIDAVERFDPALGIKFESLAGMRIRGAIYDELRSLDLRGCIADAIEHLPERERIVLGLRYTQDLLLADIGEILGVTESRASQIHSKAVVHVRALLPDELAPGVSG